MPASRANLETGSPSAALRASRCRWAPLRGLYPRFLERCFHFATNIALTPGRRAASAALISPPALCSGRTRPGQGRRNQIRGGSEPVRELKCQGVPPLSTPPLSNLTPFEDYMLFAPLAQLPSHCEACLAGANDDNVVPFDHE